LRQEFIEFLRAPSHRRKKKPPPPTRSAPQLATWVENNLPEGFTVFAFPEPLRKRLRTSNLCEASQQADPPPHPRRGHLGVLPES
jgi:transposase-like protein